MYNKLFEQKNNKILLFILGIIFGFILNIILGFYNKDSDYTFANINGCGIDTDQDGVIDVLEDINNDGNLYNDDTDKDGIPDFMDKDDDNDGVFTLFEDINNNGNPFDDDTDKDGVPNYLDLDDNNDGVNTLNQILKSNNITQEYRNKLIKDIINGDNPDKYKRLQEYIKYISISADGDIIPDYLQNYKNPKYNDYDLFESYLEKLNYISSDSFILGKYSDRIIYYPGQDLYTYYDFTSTGGFIYKPEILNIESLGGYKTGGLFYFGQNTTGFVNTPYNTGPSIQEIYKYIYEYVYTGNGFNNFVNNFITSTGQTIIYIYTGNTGGGNYQNNNGGGGGSSDNSSTGNQLKPYADYYRCSNPFGGTPIEHGKSVFAYQYSSVEYPNICKGENRICDNGTLGGSFIEKSCIQVGDNCQTPWGTSIKHGQTITTYSSNYVSFSEGCDSVMITRQCLNGVLGGSTNGKLQNCQEQKAKTCVGPDGNIYLHNQVATYYKYPKVIGELKDGEDICPRQARRCYDGFWYDLELTKKLNFTYSNSQCIAVVQ